MLNYFDSKLKGLSYRICLGLDKPDSVFYAQDYLNPSGINTYQNLLQVDGVLLHGLNIYAPGLGILAKRPGYDTNNSAGASFGTVPGQVNTLFDFQFQNGGTMYLYAASGSVLNYSFQGTGAWTQASPGTINNNAYVGNAVFNGNLAIGDGNAALWTSSNGTVFTQPASGPIASQMAVFHNRLYTVDGTSSNTQYAVANDITNWANSGTSDSSNFANAGQGANTGLFVAGDRLFITKNKGNIFAWDDTSQVDLATEFGPSSPLSIKKIDDYWFYMNQYGITGFNGATRDIISNPIQRQFYNRANTGLASGVLGTAPATTHFFNYYLAVGNIKDNLINRQTINNAIIVYDYQKNIFTNWTFNNTPTAMHSYLDKNGIKQFIFGDASGNIYQLNNTKTSDNGAAIPSEMIFFFNYSNQQQSFSQTSASSVSGANYEKKWNWYRAFFSPGCEMNISFAFCNSIQFQNLLWSDPINTMNLNNSKIATFANGVFEIRFPNDPRQFPRSRFLLVRMYESSDNANWVFHGQQIDADDMIIK